MTPAEELAAAADRLERLTAEATPAPWQIYEFSVVGGSDREFGVIADDGLLPDDAAYIATMDPLVGKALTANLRAYQVAVERHWRVFHEMWKTEQRIRMMNDQMPGLVQALDLARLINRGES